jgi:hypothetical protein
LLDSTAESYSRVWNIGFANNISRRQANELQDMIYKELVYLYNQDGKRHENIRGYVPDYGH